MLRTYQQTVGTVIAAQNPLNVQTLSKILVIPEENIRAALDPIGSIINTPTNNNTAVHFYHATAKEFLTGPPQGDNVDRAFFFSDVKGVFLALPLLKILNSNLKRNMANTEDSIPLGKGKRPSWNVVSNHVWYAAAHWAVHLDLSSASKELWAELRLFLTTKLLFWLELEIIPENTLQLVLKQEKVSNEHLNKTVP